MDDSTVRHAKPFGADHGLIHEAVVTGRKVGADEAFWKALAHNEDLFRAVRDFVDRHLQFGDLVVDSEGPTEISKWLRSLSLKDENFGFSVRVRHALLRYGLEVIGDLLDSSESELLEIPQLGPVGVKEIRRVLGVWGLGLCADERHRAPAWLLRLRAAGYRDILSRS